MRKKRQKHLLSISKQALSQLPAEVYTGPITVVDTVEAILPAIEKLEKAKIIGFDTETRPSFKKGQHFNVSLIQLSTNKECFLFRINKTGITRPLRDLLENPGKIKVGLSLHDDFINLAKITDLTPRGFVDLQQYVKTIGILDNSLTRIYAIVFGHRISKNQRLTNWEAPDLTPHQQQYAALDAVACVKIYQTLSGNKFNPADSPYIVTENPYIQHQPTKDEAASN